MLTGALPSYAVYECADGKHIAVGALEPKFFQALIQAVGQPELSRLPLAPGPGGDALRAALTDLFKRKPRDEWEQLLAHLETCVSAVLSPAEALQNEQVRSRALIEMVGGKQAIGLPLKFSHAHAHGGQSPKLGAHNAEILGD